MQRCCSPAVSGGVFFKTVNLVEDDLALPKIVDVSRLHPVLAVEGAGPLMPTETRLILHHPHPYGSSFVPVLCPQCTTPPWQQTLGAPNGRVDQDSDQIYTR